MHSPSSSNRIPAPSAHYEPTRSIPTIGIVNDGYESSNPSLNLSRSWTGLSAEVNQNPGGASGSAPHHANSMGHLRVPSAAPLTRANRKNSRSGPSPYPNRVSQVWKHSLLVPRAPTNFPVPCPLPGGSIPLLLLRNHPLSRSPSWQFLRPVLSLFLSINLLFFVNSVFVTIFAFLYVINTLIVKRCLQISDRKFDIYLFFFFQNHVISVFHFFCRKFKKI